MVNIPEPLFNRCALPVLYGGLEYNLADILVHDAL